MSRSKVGPVITCCRLIEPAGPNRAKNHALVTAWNFCATAQARHHVASMMLTMSDVAVHADMQVSGNGPRIGWLCLRKARIREDGTTPQTSAWACANGYEDACSISLCGTTTACKCVLRHVREQGSTSRTTFVRRRQWKRTLMLKPAEALNDGWDELEDEDLLQSETNTKPPGLIGRVGQAPKQVRGALNEVCS